jgi:endonuclease/exonuclease/phosphatase family metal-dependent hydrolase
MSPKKLRVLTWNLSFGYGLGSDGTAEYGEPYQPKSRHHFEFVLNSMGDYLHRLEIDLALFQEVDFNAARSYHWNHPYVPYPGLNPKQHFRSVVSGGAILSRYPIRKLNHDLLAKPREKGRVYNSFYPARYLQMAEIQVPGLEVPLKIMNCHLEAFSETNRELHWLRLSERLPDFNVDLVGGDFNGPIQLDSKVQDQWAAIPLEGKSFPSHRPDRLLDGFIIRKNLEAEQNLKLVNAKILDSGAMSDHRPIFLEFELSGM